MHTFDLVAHLYRQRAFSRATFGPGARTKGVIDHIRKELIEIESDPDDVREWIDVILLALDGAWRCGHTPEVIAGAIAAKQDKNERRDWPYWRTADPDKAIEHQGEAVAVAAATPANCPYTSCPSPFVCKSSCKGMAERVAQRAAHNADPATRHGGLPVPRMPALDEGGGP